MYIQYITAICNLIAARYATKIDVDVPNGFIYWADNHPYSNYYSGILRVKTDGSGYSHIVTSGVGVNGIQGIAVDWVAGKCFCILPRRNAMVCRIS